MIGRPAKPIDPILMAYARWDKRAAAWIVDGFLVGLGLGVVLIVASVAGGHARHGVFPYVAWLYFLLGPLVYATLFHGSTGRTPGKALLGLRVGDRRDGTPIGYGRAAARHLAGFLLWVVFVIPGLIDVVLPFFSERRQTLHDLAVRSVVLDERD